MRCVEKQRKAKNAQPMFALYFGKGADRLASCERRVWLVEAVSNNDIALTRILLSRGTDIRHSDLVLHAINNFCSKEMLEFLLSRRTGFDLNSIYSGYGLPLLHFAVLREDLETMDTLIRYGADVNCRDIFGSTPLHKALPYLSESVVSYLLDHGSDVNALNDCGELPLHKVWRCELHGEAAYTVFKHIVKLHTAKMYLSESNAVNLCEVSEELRFEVERFRESCEREITQIKETRIGNTPFTYYNILTDNPNRLANYAQNPEILCVLNASEYRQKYPLYASIIRNNFRMGMERSKLIEKGTRKFDFIFQTLPHLPLDCVLKIFSYLTNRDLKILIGYNPRNVVHWHSLSNLMINYYPPRFSRCTTCCEFFREVRHCIRNFVRRIRDGTSS